MRGASILDGLSSKENILRGVVVEGAVAGAIWGCVGLIRWVFEEEYDSIYGLECEKFRGVESEEFFELDVFDAEVLDEGCEDTLEIVSVKSLRVPKEYAGSIPRRIQLLRIYSQ